MFKVSRVHNHAITCAIVILPQQEILTAETLSLDSNEFYSNSDGPANHTSSNIGTAVNSYDEKQKGEFLIMTHKGEEEVGFKNNRSFPHWNDLYTNEASVGSLPWYN